MSSYVVDSYAWFAYLDGSTRYREIIDSNELFTPAIVVAELSRLLLKRNVANREAILTMVSRKGVVILIDLAAAVKGGETATRESLALADALIYAHATADAPLLTGDEHFRGRKNVHFVK